MKESFLERMIQKSLWIQRRGMSKSVSPSDIFLCPWLISLNKLFHWTNDFTEQAILLKERFLWTNDFTEQTILTEQTFSLNKRFHCKQTISLNERFHWTNDFSERKMSLNKRFHWTNDFSKRTKDFSEQANSLNERLVSIYERKRRKTENDKAN